MLDNERYRRDRQAGQPYRGGGRSRGVAKACGIADARSISTLAEVEAFAQSLPDVSAGPRFANVKIDAANLERVLSSRDGIFILNRLRGSLGFGPI